MAKSENQRLKLLYLLRILSEETDDNHGLNLKDITAKLNAYDITADRKTLYSDFENLRHFGVDNAFLDRYFITFLASAEVLSSLCSLMNPSTAAKRYLGGTC